MKQAITFGIVLLIVGLIVGYAVFGKIGGRYVSILSIMGIHVKSVTGFFANVGDKFGAFDKIRTNIVLCGLGGLAAGFVLGLLYKKR